MLKFGNRKPLQSPHRFMSSTNAKPFLNPAIQAKLLKLRVIVNGLARDFWKDAPMPWPAWALKIKADITVKQELKRAKAAAAASVRKEKVKAETVDVMPVHEPTVWTADRVQVLETMWGEGQTLPGGAEYITSLTSPLGVNQEMSILDLGAGLGALARQLAEHYKAYVTGLEQDPNLAARGMVMSIAHGKSKMASIVVYDPANFTPSRKFDVIVAREVFYRIIGKEKFFKAIDASLKTGGGQIVFTDYILNPEAREKPAVTQWLTRERGAAPLSMIETIKLWKGMGYDLRIAEDQTPFYKDSILLGLRDLAQHMVMNVPDRETKLVVLHEIDLWAKRLAAFHAGLRYCRFYGIKY